MNLFLKRFQKGDKDAFVRLINEHEISLYRVAKQILKNDFDVADALQETILSAYKNIDTLKYDKYLKTWLIRILINHCYTILRRNKKVILFDSITTQYSEDNLDDNLILRNLIENLSLNERVAINLYYVEGYNFREISEILNENENTIKSRVLRARKKLKDLYCNSNEEGDISVQR